MHNSGFSPGLKLPRLRGPEFEPYKYIEKYLKRALRPQNHLTQVLEIWYVAFRWVLLLCSSLFNVCFVGGSAFPPFCMFPLTTL